MLMYCCDIDCALLLLLLLSSCHYFLSLTMIDQRTKDFYVKFWLGEEVVIAKV